MGCDASDDIDADRATGSAPVTSVRPLTTVAATTRPSTTVPTTTSGSTVAPAAGTAPPGVPTCAQGEATGRRFVICTSSIGTEQPLVVALHGRGSSAEEMRLATGLDARTAADGMAVVFAEALDGGWGDDTFVTSSRPAGDEDLRGLDEVVASGAPP